MPRARSAVVLLLLGGLLGVVPLVPGAASAQEAPPAPVVAPPVVPVVPPVVPVLVPQPATPTVGGFLRVGLSTTLVRGNGALTVSGRYYRAANAPVAGAQLDVLGRVPGAGLVPLGRVTTDATGLAALSLVPRVTREYQLRTVTAPAVTSTLVRVDVQPLLSGAVSPSAVQLRSGAVLSGRLVPAYLGARLTVQRRLATGWAPVATVGTAADGSYRWAVTPGATGRYAFRAVLASSPARRVAVGPTSELVVESRTLRSGDRGADVLLLQQRLRAVHADVGPASDVFGYDLVHAVTAFQKSQGLPRTGVYDAATRARLAAPAPVVLRYPSSGRAVEVDLAKQVLYLSEGGRLTRIVDVSTGSDRLYESDGVTYRAYTPVGRFHVTRKIDGVRVSRLGELYRPAYFTQGWAVHGSGNVPSYPDSHGCVRVTNPAMDRLFGLLTVGVPVSVYPG